MTTETQLAALRESFLTITREPKYDYVQDSRGDTVERESTPMTDAIMAKVQAALVEAERRGEIYQIKMLQHWQNLHDLLITPADLEHFAKSLEQFPAQPLARETLNELAQKENPDE